MESHYKKRKRLAKEAKFKNGFPNKAAVETRINEAIDGATNLSQLKQNLKTIFNGGSGKPGIVDALFHLDR